MIDIPIEDIRRFCRAKQSDDVELNYAYEAAKAEAAKEFDLPEDEEPSAEVIMYVLKRTYRHFEHRIDGVTSESIQGVGSVSLSDDTKIKRGRVKFI